MPPCPKAQKEGIKYSVNVTSLFIGFWTVRLHVDARKLHKVDTAVTPKITTRIS